ncbi:DNA sulfur modification protein DndE [Metabacillus fastidiosus]|uniref:DNA sulfur modification protein DndE n=1 Tax=Metabacillus fastidiosus TaxID=1458 RepID=UPI000825364F|nr:DNA sulfur modification protein DndE [Metabacillus fastidiosus]MED4462723.1 DNA sulfur modification protein DndE [Metabacillus fastidiosus]
MSNRLRISKITSDKLAELQSPTNFTRNILVRLAIGLSLQDPSMPNLVNDKAPGGFDIDRFILTGEYDLVYKTLITQHAQREVSDEEYFPTLFNAHLERGIILLENEYKHAGNAEKFMINLLQK